MREILANDKKFPYLQRLASQRLEETRAVCRKTGLLNSCISQAGEHSLTIMPWTGTIQMRSICRILRYGFKEQLKISNVGGRIPYYLIVNTQLPKEEFENRLCHLCRENIDNIEVLDEDEVPFSDKFDCFLPIELVRGGYRSNELDSSGAINDLIER
jgi:ATP-dependent Lhr-like helicase